jgi:PRTRC genetic system protein E
MFTELKAMLRKGDQVTVTIAVENDTQLRVNVFPKLFTLDGENGEDRKALNTPLTITATPDELDSPAFIETLTKFSASTTATRNTLEEVAAQHKATIDAAKKGRGASSSSSSSKAKPTTAKHAPAAETEAPAEPAAPADDDTTESLGL